MTPALVLLCALFALIVVVMVWESGTDRGGAWQSFCWRWE